MTYIFLQRTVQTPSSPCPSKQCPGKIRRNGGKVGHFGTLTSKAVSFAPCSCLAASRPARFYRRISLVQYDPTAPSPIPAQQLDYRGEPPRNFLPLLRTLCVLTLLIGTARTLTIIVDFFPYLTGASLPASYPSLPFEILLNALAFAVGLFGIIAAIIALGSASAVRPLIIWSWCSIVWQFQGVGFDVIFQLRHIPAAYQKYSGYYATREVCDWSFRLIADLVLPVTIIVMQRVIHPRRS
jgi:hypothetical protein